MIKDDQCFNCLELITKCNCGETEGYSSNGSVCPYCGETDLADQSEGYIFDESHDTNTCPSCNKEYQMDLYISYTWTTRKLQPEQR